MTKTSKDEKTDFSVRYRFEFGQNPDDNDFSEWLFGKYLLKIRFVKVIRGFVYRITERKLWIVVCLSSESWYSALWSMPNRKVCLFFVRILPATRGKQFCCPLSTYKCFLLAFEWSNMWQAYLFQFLPTLHQRSSRDYFAIIRQMLPFLHWMRKSIIRILINHHSITSFPHIWNNIECHELSSLNSATPHEKHLPSKIIIE